MSPASPPEPPAETIATTKQPTSLSVAQNIKKQSSSSKRPQHPLDARFDRLIKDVLPSAPYLLRLRNRSAQYHGRDRYYWRKDTHFKEDEEELQYLTFRPTHDGTILYAHGQWDDGDGGIAPKEFPSSQTSSGQTPLKGQIVTKKITLAEYAKMDKSKAKTPDPMDSGVNQAVEKTSQEVGEAPKQEVEKTKDEIQPDNDLVSISKGIEDKEKAIDPIRKRSPDAIAGANDATTVEHEASSPPSKKSRVEDELVKDAEAQDELEHNAAQENPKPDSEAAHNSEDSGNPDPEEDQDPIAENNTAPEEELAEEKTENAPLHGLPPMLSPTLPFEIEEELAKRSPRLRGGVGSSRVSSASPGVRSKDQRRDASTGPKIKSSSNNLPSTPKIGGPDPKKITSAPRQPAEDDASHSAVESVASKKSKIVTLKIRNKGNRRTLTQYLRMKPTPNRGSRKTTAKSGSADILSDSNTSKVSSQSKVSRKNKLAKEDESSGTDEPLAKRLSTKRRAAELDEEDLGKSNTKRRKESGQEQQDTTSKKPTSAQDQSHGKAATSTPSQSLPNSAQKSHLNVMSTAMQRTASQESAATPARDNTPTANGHKPESPERREWKKDVKLETNRLVKLATEIKHDSDVYLKFLTGDEYEKYRQLGTVIATEATLCFMLAAMVSDEPGRSSRTHSSTDLWKSTRDFMSSLSSNHAKKFQYLSGFLKQLEGVVCDTLTYQHDMRGDAILREYYRLKGQEAAVATTTANADSYIAENWIFLKEAQETRVRARAAWREGQMALFDRELEREFSKTWSRRRDFAGRGKGRDPVTLKNYGKEGFALPLGVNSTALEAVNFGLAFLAELCEKEGMEWKPKLIL